MLKAAKSILFGPAKDPLSKEHRHQLALVAFLAWVGLGADGLSSSCYGPELGFLALGHFQHLAIYLSLITSLTIFLIAVSYNQVIELFPNGGGGYRVANDLLGPLAGVISGSALLIDYILTISISLASAVEAIGSLLPLSFQAHKIGVELFAVLFLVILNLRGMKESIKILLPIFLGFFISHLCIIFYGIFVHAAGVPLLFHYAITESHEAISTLGLAATLAIFLRAYSLGSGTYTGLEAVSNNINMLAEPRVRTGKVTMLYMALSLSFVAGGIILLYLLWNVNAISGMTLNAVVFTKILGDGPFAHLLLILLLFFEAGLLFVGANTGFLGGPAVLANMAQDDWVPRRFANLSTRLVKQNGILFFGALAAFVIFMTNGAIELLVIFYAINVFITFSVSLLGLSFYWLKNKESQKRLFRFCLSFMGFIVCAFILTTTIITKWHEGSAIAILATLVMIGICYYLKNAYSEYELQKQKLDEALEFPINDSSIPLERVQMDPEAATAVFLVKELGSTMHTMMWVERMFPAHFKNYVFLFYGVVDTESFGSEVALKKLELKSYRLLKYLSRFAQSRGLATFCKTGFGTNEVEGCVEMGKDINELYPNSVYFASRYVFSNENMITKMLHSEIAFATQRSLQSIGTKILIVPLNLDLST